ncbi:uncharacterized protein LOC123300821 [Chrysoperla carnea]|uniref:uncharacterized protein LOC123300821 n=1 Tax=Chrysoperla carnea TaxID=189513 RepID=UPI001D080E31|nr:uncharacterized protein LOC123300821 [Chrysoperla carnea]XP_044739403.1 uncharacterized protein LOC123300821 [Chrysoperla carnea]
MSDNSLDYAFLIYVIVIIVCVLLVCCSIWKSVYKCEENEERIHRHQNEIYLERIRVIAMQNAAVTFDHSNHHPSPIHQLYLNRYGSQPPMYEEGVFPGDLVGNVENPPPSYEEALRATLVHNNNSTNNR